MNLVLRVSPLKFQTNRGRREFCCSYTCDDRIIANDLKQSKQTGPKDRLERAISYWIEHRPISTLEEIKRVAKRFGVHYKSLREAIRLLDEVEKKTK